MNPVHVWYCECGWHNQYKSPIVINECPMCKSFDKVDTVEGTQEEMDEFERAIAKGNMMEYVTAFKQYRR